MSDSCGENLLKAKDRIKGEGRKFGFGKDKIHLFLWDRTENRKEICLCDMRWEGKGKGDLSVHVLSLVTSSAKRIEVGSTMGGIEEDYESLEELL